MSIDKAVSFGVEKETKTGKTRVVPILKPLAQDLNEWRLASGHPDDAAPVFPAASGAYWKDHDYRNWRKRVFNLTAAALGIARLYDLRHSYASLRFAESVNAAEIAEEMGHSLETLFSTYAHVIVELRGAGTRLSRKADPHRSQRHDYQKTKKALFPRESTKPSAGLEPATPSLPSPRGLPRPFPPDRETVLNLRKCRP